jgi:hypothetical protein
MLHAGFLTGIFFNTDDGGDMFSKASFYFQWNRHEAGRKQI